jgi:hypothetical protein
VRTDLQGVGRGPMKRMAYDFNPSDTGNRNRRGKLLGMVQADRAFVFDFNDDDDHRFSNLVAHQIGGPVIRE